MTDIVPSNRMPETLVHEVKELKRTVQFSVFKGEQGDFFMKIRVIPRDGKPSFFTLRIDKFVDAVERLWDVAETMPDLEAQIGEVAGEDEELA